MSELPKNVSKAWDNRKGPVVLATTDKQGVPNAVWITCVSKYNEEIILVADNYFCKTQKNILEGSKGAILFITEENESFQVKGTLTYHKEGPMFDDMKKWNPAKHPGHAAMALKVEEVYSGSEQLL